MFGGIPERGEEGQGMEKARAICLEHLLENSQDTDLWSSDYICMAIK